jgi:hypothetical protein
MNMSCQRQVERTAKASLSFIVNLSSSHIRNSVSSGHWVTRKLELWETSQICLIYVHFWEADDDFPSSWILQAKCWQRIFVAPSSSNSMFRPLSCHSISYLLPLELTRSKEKAVRLASSAATRYLLVAATGNRDSSAHTWRRKHASLLGTDKRDNRVLGGRTGIIYSKQFLLSLVTLTFFATKTLLQFNDLEREFTNKLGS